MSVLYPHLEVSEVMGLPASNSWVTMTWYSLTHGDLCIRWWWSFFFLYFNLAVTKALKASIHSHIHDVTFWSQSRDFGIPLSRKTADSIWRSIPPKPRRMSLSPLCCSLRREFCNSSSNLRQLAIQVAVLGNGLWRLMDIDLHSTCNFWIFMDMN